jgi:hypothetical protein
VAKKRVVSVITTTPTIATAHHRQRPHSSNRMLTVGQNFEGPNADIKETAPAVARNARLSNQ